MLRKISRFGASIVAAGGALFAASNASAALTVESVSALPRLVSGSSVLVLVKGATTAPEVSWENRDLSSKFVPDRDHPGQYLGLIIGLVHGKNQPIEVTSGSEKASLVVVNQQPNERLFSGRLQYPYVCELGDLGLGAVAGQVTGANPGRGDAFQDPKTTNCFASTKIEYLYKNAAGEWKPFNPLQRPTDIMKTKIDGKDVNLIVRQEKGVLNRSGYVINILHDPAAGPAPDYTGKGGSAWNGKLVYSFGGGVRAGFHQGRTFGGLNAMRANIEETGVGALDAWITRGYAVAAGSLNVSGTTTNDVVSAETAYRVKEQFIKLYGPPIYTIGSGASGGAMQQQVIANAYPGILDGIIPHIEFADFMTFLQPLNDCDLLVNAFKTGTWTREQMQAVSGAYWGYCVSNATRYPVRAVDSCDAPVTAAINKDPILKAQGVRCTYQDNMVQVFGVDPKTGFARNPFDNVGVQYGMQALNDGKITIDQFIDLNTRVGGHDVNGKIVAQRQVGDAEALRIAYETGRVNLETGGNAAIPQVATRDFREADYLGRGDANVDVHDKFATTIVQARLQKYLGTSGTMVHLQTASAAMLAPGMPLNQAYLDALTGIDKWIMAIKADTSNKTPTQKVVANKPADLVNACYTDAGKAIVADPKAVKIEKMTDMAKCDAIFPQFSHPRIVAGSPITEDVFKCQLKPIDAKDYKVAPTAAQMMQLQAAFPQGVCDFTKPGVGQTAKVATWAFFKDDGEYRGL
jgi:hypothetical protein